MNLHDTGFEHGWMLGGAVVYLVALFWSFRTAPWHKIEDREAQHVFLATSVLLFFLWSVAASVGSGLTFHFLMSALVTMMFGPQFAIMAASLALLGVTLTGGAGLLMFGVNAVLMGVIPILLVWWIARLAYVYLAHNFFVFVLLNGFFAAGLSVLVTLMLSASAMWLSGAQTPEKLEQSFLPFIPLLVIPEGFVNGLILTALVLMKPQWVSCFTDEQYLNGK
ncbi:energy-coupling factor ABC transporter permease [Hydrogenovibrio halophilus]|uniref:energy-coupling factor ABC transporter permease n=1 Tax=Hydrogenovibrio halophilus TaxID=373391 RepID=UPI00036AC047|nr:energy-coupling factor ABC transporter permease [Hydrogenovibrio halophilus]